MRSRVRHTDRRVKAVVRYDDLVRNTDTTTAGMRLRISKGETYLLRLTAGPGKRRDTVVFGRYTDDGFADVACTSVHTSVQQRRSGSVVSVGRACLERPRWVRYDGQAVAIEEGAGTNCSYALLGGDPVNDLLSKRIRQG